MRTTIDLPDSLLERTKISATKQKTTMRELVIQGLEIVLSQPPSTPKTDSALKRLKKGYDLGNQPLTRDETHAR
jgi:hypothetical protein